MYWPKELDDWAAEQLLISAEMDQESKKDATISALWDFYHKVSAVVHSPGLSDVEKVSELKKFVM